jgi:hypothetical protein
LLPEFLSQGFLDLKAPDSGFRTGRLAVPDPRVPGPESSTYGRLAFSEEFVGAHCDPGAEADHAQPGIYNYFFGKDSTKWVTHVRGYSEVVYHGVWDGIDLRLHGNGSDIEQEFVVKPGADLSKVRVAYKGIDGLRLAHDGSLVIKTAFGELQESKPRIYQEIARKQEEVEGRFKLSGDGAYTFEVTSYQPEYALVVDPTLLYSTFLGGTTNLTLGFPAQLANSIAVDSSGNAYVTGFTDASDFPLTTGAIQAQGGCNGSNCATAFVTKFNAVGSQLVYSTYLTASYSSVGQGIAVDSSGEAYVVGWASDYAPEFPTTANAYQTGCPLDSHFMTKLNAKGDRLVYSTCFPGDSGAYPYGGRPMGVALDRSGHAYIAGTAACSTPTTVGAYQPACPGSSLQAFVVEFDPAASGTASLLYGTYLGGTSSSGVNAFGYGIAVDSSGIAYVAGSTNRSRFPCYRWGLSEGAETWGQLLRS